MWRCFSSVRLKNQDTWVCSTHVEMFLNCQPSVSSDSGLLHACGDVSPSTVFRVETLKFAPRMWRCFCRRFPYHQQMLVCSTHVEMFPFAFRILFSRSCLLHACGDVSAVSRLVIKGREFAPRMWRFFHAGGLHLRSGRGLLHACGDVSDVTCDKDESMKFAPRMLRCFLHHHRYH